VTEHLPALQVVLPLVAAPLCIFLRNPLLVRGFALIVALCCLGISGTLLSQVLEHGRLSYWMGGWAPPLGIELAVDRANAFMLVIVTMIASVVLMFGNFLHDVRLPEGREYLFYAAYLLAVCGLSGIAITGDAFNVFVFLEVTSLASYTLISLGKDRRALSAAFTYLVMGTIGGTFILIGIGLAYQMTGTLNIADLAVRLKDVMHTRTVLVSFAFIMVGSSIKLAVFPLHQWLPNAYTYAPNVISAFLAATATKVSYYVLVRVIYTVFGASFIFGTIHLDLALLPLSVAAMFIGSIAAIYQADLKRLLAYSSIAQIGYMTLGLSLNSVLGLTGGIVHLFNHALMKGGLFLVVGCLAYRVGSTRIDDLKGLGRRMPVTAFAFAIGGLGLIGVPATAGFVSKWFLVLAVLEKGWWWLAVLILLSSLLAVVYVWRVIEVLYFGQRDEDAPAVTEVPATMLIPAWILIGGAVYFGINTELTAGVALQAAEQLLGVTR